MKPDFLETIQETKRLAIEASQRRIPQAILETACSTPRTRRPFPGHPDGPESSRIHVIAEVKRASPSKGAIRLDIDPAHYARACEKAGASAMSVLTEAAFFRGSLEDARTVRESVAIPVLRKDFILSPYQVYETRAAGLDALLLIVRILDPGLLSELLALCRQLDLDALVEVASEREIEIALQAGAATVGINARNLATFETDLSVCARLRPLLRNDITAIALSGIRNRRDIEFLAQAGFRHFLIGETLSRAADPGAVLRQLIEGERIQ
ncbi:indole-3-glycerol phosphate synthase TrpC [Desulfatirhabdium butyrativorans]|uniref:indole-3-glycerol phosphate synthase TrpC n=1 Tax=Desulfatirhabdium butyrativorans TaxID=340467 RepID=UPI00040DCB3D|nr:indole-3-glycerol phosphate synthase TrpC [Desulfatirhabdium butyrativorans]